MLRSMIISWGMLMDMKVIIINMPDSDTSVMEAVRITRQRIQGRRGGRGWTFTLS